MLERIAVSFCRSALIISIERRSSSLMVLKARASRPTSSRDGTGTRRA